MLNCLTFAIAIMYTKPKPRKGCLLSSLSVQPCHYLRPQTPKRCSIFRWLQQNGLLLTVGIAELRPTAQRQNSFLLRAHTGELVVVQLAAEEQ